MESIAWAAGAFCILYYLACGIYAGFGASFLGIWPAAGIVFFLCGAVCHLHRKGRYLLELPHGIRLAFGGLVLAGVLLFLVMEGLIASQMFARGEQGMDYLLVLGAQVRGDKVSRALEDRLKTAKQYLEENPDTRAILSGGQGPGENLTEAQAMYDWLTKRGIDGDRLICEDRSTSTWENMVYSKAMVPEDAADITIGMVTNNFHVYRSVMLARCSGFEKACGIAAESHSLMQLHFLVREGIALAKDIVKYKVFGV